ncbi:MAG: M3 family oligoendopeptidase [Myxococcota bacterium]|nr:M3 family oligoendopeptidase [Myxococcota bacterium]
MQGARFSELRVETPEPSRIEARYAEIEAALDAQPDAAALLETVRRWDALRTTLETWLSLARVRFTQDTRDPEAKRTRERADELAPRFQGCDVRVMRRLLAEPHRVRLEGSVGPQALALWECAVQAFEPAIQDDKVAEAKLTSEYTELMASAQLPIRGEVCNHETLFRWLEDPDRGIRREAVGVRNAWFEEHGERLDDLYDRLVRLRDGMGRKLGDDGYLPMAYRLMQRVDYGPDDVARYRDAVREHVVPLVGELRAQQAGRLGVERLMWWDEFLGDPAGNPRPQGDRAWMVERARELFSRLGGGLREFFDGMVARDLLDLDARDGKAAGGYCDFFGAFRVPFIFASFSGTKRDVEVFTHEMGHAFQVWSSRDKFPFDLIWPSMESCEIHSMSLEFLCGPHLELFFGAEAERFRRLHLEQSLCFLPYGVAVDHFQHLVFERPEASPAERHALWQRMERTYLPWRDYGDLARMARGGLWQGQLHVYTSPFYYIDYTLALVCALQFAQWAERDREGALEGYVALCRRGGEAAFQSLVRGAGLKSPFDRGCLEEVVGHAREALG